MMITPVRCGHLLVGAFLLFSQLTPVLGADESINYVEAAKPIEPLETKKALELATTFFVKKYPPNPKNYFASKMEYGQYANSPHPYSWEITFSAKPGYGIVLGAPFLVVLMVEPDGKVSLEKELRAELPTK